MKKIGKIWLTEKSKVHIQNYIVESIYNSDTSPVIVKSTQIEYVVYGKNKKQYNELIKEIKEL